ncbi:thiamine-monophosphate kinase [Desulfurobacterium thermolithotrophum DSM 11699]|uniref:Thiamine-monophosphate kinase n=1 Tax=Desulfurobacterium thermolithotrophum (strain DSM 11699 / BSA) TaxID=868864 RepID=F0S1U3_DESTD|nr:thiamine-phosphate kinase [Desulfurobacterium thermolithotrophum]ADY72948.1 thiamine-monophosphate kinase [Desulfurobacterium thermolithotrophum DSM 11699]
MKLSEFELISKLTRKLSCPSEKVVVGIGDDAAVVKLNGSYQIITSDALVENSHYKREWINNFPELYYYLGRKLLSISISDVASMGGVPEFAIINLGVSNQSEEELLEALYDGLSDACKDYRVSIVGGDTVASETEFFDSTLTGKSKGYMLRSLAKPKDLVAVTGTFGDSRAGLEILLENKPIESYLVKRFLDPSARVKEGKEALTLGVQCGTDVSDGLIFNLYTISESSNVKIDIFSEKIPISKELISYVGTRERALQYALFGGEDYELIITFPEKLLNSIERIGFKVIGVVSEGNGVFLDGKRIKKVGFDHLRSVE